MRLPLLLAFFSLTLCAATSLDTPVALPASLVVGQATQITASCHLRTSPGDAALLPAGINLVRLNAAGVNASVIGVMHDDGLNGDLTAGDGIYSYQFSANEAAAGQFLLQCTAALASTIDRVRSPSFTITAATPGATNPTITDFNPKTGPVGTLVSLTGSNLVSSTGVVATLSLTAQGGGVLSAPLSSATAGSLSFVVPAGAATGPVSVSNGAATAVSSVNLTVTPSSTFSLSALPSSATLIAGQTVAYAVRLSSSTGFSQLAQLSLTGLPAGITASFRPAGISSGQTSILTLTAPANQAVNTASLSVLASATVDGLPVSGSASATVAVSAPTTSFIGRTVVADPAQTSLAGVTVTMLGRNGSGAATGCTGSTVSDGAGNFVLSGLAANCVGPQLIGFGGDSVTSPSGRYAGVNLVYTLASGQVTVSPVLVHLPRIDNAEAFQVQQNAATDQTYSFSSVPGVKVTVYAHTTFRQSDGTMPNPFPLVAVQVPVDRLPEVMPPSNTIVMPFIVAFQPANVVASQSVAVSYPSTLNTPPGTTLPLMTLDPTRGRMVSYGTATVSTDGTSVVPNIDPATGAAQHRFGIVNFDWHGWGSTPPNGNNPGGGGGCDGSGCPGGGGGNDGGGCSASGSNGGSNEGGGNPCNVGKPPAAGDPVDLSSGLHLINAVDLEVKGSRGSIGIRRIYRTLSTNDGPFGIGSQSQYSWQLNTGAPNSVMALNLISPDGNQFLFSRQPDGTLTNATVPSLQGAVMTTNANGTATLKYYNGMIHQFQAFGAQVSVLSSITDRNGNATTLTQAGFGTAVRITRIADPVGRYITLTYTGTHVASATDSNGSTVSYTYNPSGTLATFTNAAGGITRFQYDAQNRISSLTDARGVATFRNTYDATGRVATQTFPDGGVVRFSYLLVNPLVVNSPVQLTTVTDALGYQTVYRFNPQGFVTYVTDAMGQTKTFTRDPVTNMLIQVSGTGQCKVCGPRGQGTVDYTYDSAGNVMTSTNALGHVWHYTYTALNEIASATDPLNNNTVYTYDAAGNLTSLTDAKGHTTNYTYDPHGLPLRATDALGFSTTTQYDQTGNPVSITDALGNTRTALFDGASRPAVLTDPLGKKTSLRYDALNRVISMRDGRGSTVRFNYDSTGNLLSLVDPRGNTTSFTYDQQSRVTARTSPLGTSDTFQYDLDGNVVQSTDRRGQVSNFQFDSLNRLVREQYQDGATVTRAYDPYGRLKTVDDSAGGTFGFGYDLTGALVSQIQPNGVVTYTRDAVGRVATRQVAGQTPVTYSYDAAGNLAGASTPGAGVVFSYDARDLPTVQTRTNGVASTYSFDPLGQVISLTHAKGQTAINTQSYAYDAARNRTSAVNDVSQPLITQATIATVNSANELLTHGPSSFTSDANGNRVTETGLTGVLTYVWDTRNRLTSITAQQQTVTFKYDFSGMMIAKQNTGGGSPVTETYILDNRANVVSQNVNGLPYLILTGRSVDEHFAIIPSGGTATFGLVDSLNSTVALSDADGARSGTYTYEPFGQQSSQAANYPFQFTGRTNVGIGGLYYYRARFYDSGAARFLSTDPLGFAGGGTNLYAYTRNNPVGKNDPFGLATPGDIGDFWDTFGPAPNTGDGEFNEAKFLGYCIQTILTPVYPPFFESGLAGAGMELVDAGSEVIDSIPPYTPVPPPPGQPWPEPAPAPGDNSSCRYRPPPRPRRTPNPAPCPAPTPVP